MDLTYNSLRSKEVVNIYDGKCLGKIIDISFDNYTGKIIGFIVPGIKKVFKKSEDIFIPLELIKKIGEDVILVKLSPVEDLAKTKKQTEQEIKNTKTYVRYKRVQKR